MVKRIPEWENELWYYLSTGEGIHCPLYNQCLIRQGGDWCLDDNAECLRQLDDGRPFSLDNYKFVESGSCGRVLELVEKLASRYLTRGSVRTIPVPTDIIALFDDEHPIKVHLIPLTAYHGALWFVNSSWIIQLNDTDTLAKRRITLFHEAFHIIAHNKTNPIFKKIGTTYGCFNELLADHFARCLLIPREWIVRKWKENKDFNSLVKIFDVPQSAMCFRLKRLGLI